MPIVLRHCRFLLGLGIATFAPQVIFNVWEPEWMDSIFAIAATALGSIWAYWGRA